MTGGHIVDDDEASDRDRLENLVNIVRSRYSDRYREQAEGAVIEQVIPGALDDLDIEVSQDLASSGADRGIWFVTDNPGAFSCAPSRSQAAPAPDPVSHSPMAPCTPAARVAMNRPVSLRVVVK